MKQKPKKQFTYWLSVAIVGIALGLALQFVRAWTEPSAAPPGGNLGAPINTSAAAQTKAGGITAGTLTAATVTGTTQFCLGTSCITSWPSGGAPACQCDVTPEGWLRGPGCSGNLPPGNYPCGTAAMCSNGWGPFLCTASGSFIYIGS